MSTDSLRLYPNIAPTGEGQAQQQWPNSPIYATATPNQFGTVQLTPYAVQQPLAGTYNPYNAGQTVIVVPPSAGTVQYAAQPDEPKRSSAGERCSEFFLTLIATVLMILSVHPNANPSIWNSISLTSSGSVIAKFGLFKFCLSDQCTAITMSDTEACTFIGTLLTGSGASIPGTAMSSYCSELHSAQTTAIAALTFFGNILLFQLLIACCFGFCCCSRQIARGIALVIQLIGFGLTVATWKRGRDAFEHIGGSGLLRGTGDTLCIIAWIMLIIGAIQQFALISKKK